MKIIKLAAACAGLIGLCASLTAFAADRPVMRVLVVQTNDAAAYAHEVANLQAIFRKTGQQVTLRVWRATFAGPDTGSIVVSVEVPSLTALAQMNEALRNNAEVAAEMKRIEAMRAVTSDSIYEAVTAP